MPIKQVQWEKVLLHSADWAEARYDLKLVCDQAIVAEVDRMAVKSLDSLNMASMPNLAKVAGYVSFWIRKLKPVFHAEDTPNHYLAINELLGLMVGLALCRRYMDDFTDQTFCLPSRRIFMDWVNSLRFHSHSPHSSTLSFELLVSTR